MIGAGTDLGGGADTVIEGPHGPLRVRVYTATGHPRGGLVWVHGGAFIGGDLDMPESEWVARRIAATGVAVVTVDYQLSPIPAAFAAHVGGREGGVRFPVASEEVTAAFRWARHHSGVADDAPWVIGGASAGANLAVGAALRLRDGGHDAAGLLLAYPLVHKQLPPMREELQAKHDSLAVTERFDPETIAQLNLNYVGDEALLDHPYAFAGGHFLTGLPPTFILNSDIDSLRASGEAFAAELAADGVDLAVVREPGTRHGHLNDPDDPAAHRSIRRMLAWLDHGPLAREGSLQ